MKVISSLCFIIIVLSIGKAQERAPLTEHRIGCDGLINLPFAGQKSKTENLVPRDIDGVSVNIKSYQFVDEQIVFLEVCPLKAASKAKAVDERDRRQASVVRDFSAYEAGGRIFAYGFTAYAVLVKDGRILERYGAAGNIYYVDEDGDGTFERRRGAMSLKLLPNWVKALAGKS